MLKTGAHRAGSAKVGLPGESSEESYGEDRYRAEVRLGGKYFLYEVIVEHYDLKGG